MHKDLRRLTQIAEAKSRMIIGLMSGTSLDGLDIALCEFEGYGTSTQIKVHHFLTKTYDETLRSELRSIASRHIADLQKITLLNAYLGSYHAELILDALQEWGVAPKAVDLIASHGQTIYHAPFREHQIKPYSNATLQIGDGDHIAMKTGIITISDFRQKHIAAGGEGAPLSLYGDYLIYSNPTENRLMLNIGGISNFSYLPATATGTASTKATTTTMSAAKPIATLTSNNEVTSTPTPTETPNKSEPFSTDAGPGNTLMDQFVQSRFPGMAYDANGEIASHGKVNEQLLAELLAAPFFCSPFPKTTGQEAFSLHYVEEALKSCSLTHLDAADVVATLSALTATAVAKAITTCVPANQDYQIYVSGGGMHNTHLLNTLSASLKKTIKSTATLGLNPDAKEAVLFALLANACIGGEEQAIPYHSAWPAVSMGKISLTC
jgi:anhydro-N-acetylmuramic acid kinase